MFAQLGDIVFQGLFSPEVFTRFREANYVQHAIVDGKPRLQRVGTNLETLSLIIRLHISMGRPESAIASFNAAQDSGDVLPLVMGNGELIGNFVIVSSNVDLFQTDPNGNIIDAQLSVQVIEFTSGDDLVSRSTSAVANAFGVSTNSPAITAISSPAGSPPNSLGRQFTAVMSNSGNMLGGAAKIVSGVDRSIAIYNDTKAKIENIGRGINNIGTIINSTDSYATRFANTLAAGSSLLSELNGLNTHLQNNDFPNLGNSLTTYQTELNNYRRVFTQVASITGTRRA